MKTYLSLWLVFLFTLQAGCEDSSNQKEQVGDPNGNDPIVSVTLIPTPASALVFIGSTVEFSWYATTQSGSRLTAIAAELTVAPQVTPTDVSRHAYRFDDLGQYEVTVRLQPPHDSFSDTVNIRVTDQRPSVNLEYPARGDTVLEMAQGITLLGRTADTGTLTINGQPVTLNENGDFMHPFVPVWGLNKLVIEAQGAGITTTATPTFSYAEQFESSQVNGGTGVNLADALLAALAASFFDDGVHDHRNIDDLATVLEVIIEDSDLAAALQDTEAINALQTRQDIGELLGMMTTLDVSTTIVSPTSVGSTRVILDPVNGGIAFQAQIGNDSKPALTIRLKVDLTFEFLASDGRMGSATGSIYPTIRVGSALLSGILYIEKNPDMQPSAFIDDFVLNLNNIETDPVEDIELTLDFLGTQSIIDLSGLISLDTFSEQYIDPIINDAVTFITDSAESIVQAASETLLLQLFESLNISDTITFDNVIDPSRSSIALTYETELNRFNFTNDGAFVGFNLGVFTPPAIPRSNDGAIRRTDCLESRPNTFNQDWLNDLTFGLQGDALNGLLYGIWQAGLITGPVDLTEVLGDNSFLTGDQFNIVLDAHAPPILDSCRNEEGATLRIGDLRIELAGELINIQLDSTIFVDLDLRAAYRADEDGIYLEIGEVQTFDVEIIEVGENADEALLRPFLEDQLALIINGLLVGQGVGPVAIPALDLAELIENINTEDTLDVVPQGIRSQDGHIIIEANLD
jgi:hypothetical protein